MSGRRATLFLLLLLWVVPFSGLFLAGCGSSPRYLFHDAGVRAVATDSFAFALNDGGDFPGAIDAGFDQGSWSCAVCDDAAPAELTHRFALDSADSYTVQANLLLRAGNNRANLIGVSSQGSATDPAGVSRFLVGFSRSGLGYESDGVWTRLASHSALGGNGWYTVTVASTGQHTSVSIARFGSIQALTFSLPGVSLPHADTMLATSAALSDRQQLLRYAAASATTPQFSIPNFANIPNLVAAYALPGQGGSYAVVPSSYSTSAASRWVLYFHGYNGLGSDIFSQREYRRMTEALVNAGYVVISMNNTTENCYGNQQCNLDVEELVEQWRTSLNLARRPFLMADSMGGFTMLNAISHDRVSPAAAVGWSINVNLASAYQRADTMAHIADAYSISDQNPFAAATAGYDPLLLSGAVYAGVPMKLWSSYHDGIVPRALNADAFAARVNGAGGRVEVVTAGGGHLDASNFDPKAVVAFFDSH